MVCPAPRLTRLGSKARWKESRQEFEDDTKNNKNQDSPFNRFQSIFMSFTRVAPFSEPIPSMANNLFILIYGLKIGCSRS